MYAYNYVYHSHLLSLVVTIGFTQEEYTVTEDGGPASVCVQRSDTDLDRNIPFNLSTTMHPGEAEGMCVLLHHNLLE